MARARLNPIMTSNSTPSGLSSMTSPGGIAWQAFDGSALTSADVIPYAPIDSVVFFTFDSPTEVHGFRLTTKDAAIFNYSEDIRMQYFGPPPGDPEGPVNWYNQVTANLSGLGQGETSEDQVGALPITADEWRFRTNAINIEGGPASELYYGQLELIGADVIIPVVPVPTAQSFEIYRAILTGAEDALPDMEVRTDNIQIRRREVNPTFVQVVAADPSQFDDIAARPNGQLVISAGLFYPETDTETLNEIARGFVDRAPPSKGTARESLVLTAYGDIAATAPKPVSLPSVDFYAGDAGNQRARGGMESTVRPGDTASIPSESAAFVVNEIVYQIGSGLVSMEVQE